MKIQKLAIAALLLGASGGSVLAAQPDCPLCSMPVEANTAKVDNVVTLKSGGKTVPYRCVYCALDDRDQYKGDLTIKAPTEIKGKWVTISRKGDAWISSLPGVVFVAKKASHRYCPETYHALTSAKAFAAYAKANPMVAGSKPISLAEMIKVAS